MGNYIKALEYSRKALEIKLIIYYGEQHPDVATSYNNIGFIYKSLKDYPKALDYFEKALELKKIIFGDCHQEVASNYDNIGMAYTYMENYAMALKNFQKSLHIYTTLYGANHKTAVQISDIIYNLYCTSLKQSSKLEKDFKRFISEYAYTFTIDKDNKFYLIEYNNWYLDSVESILYCYQQNKPADIVLMYDSNIKKYHLDHTNGCKVGLKFVGKEEKKRIVKEYGKWKKNKLNDCL